MDNIVDHMTKTNSKVNANTVSKNKDLVPPNLFKYREN